VARSLQASVHRSVERLSAKADRLRARLKVATARVVIIREVAHESAPLIDACSHVRDIFEPDLLKLTA